MAVMLLCTSYKRNLNENCVFFEDLLSYISSGTYMQWH